MNKQKLFWMTSIVYVLVAIVLIFTLSTYTFGTPFEGTGEGYIEPITVEIIFNEGKITAGKVVSIAEADFALPAADTVLRQAIITGNADNLDIVAGATITSQGTIAAIQAALADAKGPSYKGTGDGYKGPITVEINVNNGKITGGKIVLISETDFALPIADAVLVRAIKTGDTDNIDAVTGATYTIDATVNAIRAALATANQ